LRLPSPFRRLFLSLCSGLSNFSGSSFFSPHCPAFPPSRVFAGLFREPGSYRFALAPFFSFSFLKFFGNRALSSLFSLSDRQLRIFLFPAASVLSVLDLEFLRRDTSPPTSRPSAILVVFFFSHLLGLILDALPCLVPWKRLLSFYLFFKVHRPCFFQRTDDPPQMPPFSRPPPSVDSHF